ncbi:glycine zipper 2TM domain-containing protein [Novosphingobium fuchskuhlense]|nr:glycine zipper 2TM domain-containing protein [Novosphingobium fuchskuhlense]
MKRSMLSAGICLTIAGAGLATEAQARHYRHHSHQSSQYRDARSDHGNCLRFNKTTGTVAGAVGGGLLGRAIFGGAGGTLGGAAVGGIAGHELANNRRKRC